MPLIDVVGPVLAQRAAGRRRTDRIIADLGMALRMRIDLAAELARQHLRAEEDAEKRLVLLERDLEPVDLAAEEFVPVVGALRPAEDHGAGVVLQHVGQRIVEARPADVEGEAATSQRVADPTRRRVLLMQHDQDRQAHGVRRLINRSGRFALNSYRVNTRLQACRARNRYVRVAGLAIRRRCRLPASDSRVSRGMTRGKNAISLLPRPGTTSRLPRIRPR